VAAYVAAALVVGFLLGLLTSQLMNRNQRASQTSAPATHLRDSDAAANAQADGAGTALAESGRVTRLIRADVVEVEGVGPVRMIGIETPDGKSTTEAYGAVGQRALKFSEEMLLNRNVRLEYDAANSFRNHRDESGHALAYVYTSDGLLVNSELVKQGLAYLRATERFRLSESFNSMEREAMQSLRGVWGVGLTGSSAATDLAANGSTTKPAEKRKLSPLSPSDIGPNIPTTSIASSAPSEPLVFLSADRLYHNRQSCELLSSRKQSAPASEARAQGYTPCSRCYPSATIRVR
jgi:micrococcal nuclease